MKESDRRLNILMFASSRRIGLTYHLTCLSRGLKRRGLNVIVLSSDKEQVKGLAEELKQEGIKHYKLDYIDEKSLYSLYRNAKEISTIINSENINIIHVNGFFHLFKSYLASKLASIKKKAAIVLTVNVIRPNSKNKKSTYIIFTRLMRLADFVIAVSQIQRQKLTASGLSPSKVTVVHNAIDFERFDKKISQKTYAIAPFDDFETNRKIVACIATLNPWKGHKYYLKAASIVLRTFPNIRFLLVGDGNLRHDLENYALRLGITENVVFTGWVSRDKGIYQILSNVDVGVMPSLSETFSHALVELLAAGKPVVTTPVGVAPEIFKEGKVGFMVPPKDSNALAKAIIRLRENPEKAKRMGAEGAKLVREKFNLNAIAFQLEGVYRVAIKLKR